MSTYSWLELKNFRSYSEYSVELSPGVNIIVGPNASGKTNLLEGLYAVSRGKSFRGSDKDLIRYDQEWFNVTAKWGKQTRSLRLKVTPESKSKELIIDDNKHKRITKKLTIPTTLFDPEHMRLIVGSPESRRSFMDVILEQIDDVFAKYAAGYKRALVQRNKLLKEPSLAEDHLFVWDLKLAEYGAYINNKRHWMVAAINEQSSEVYSKIADKKSSVELVYSKDTKDIKDYQSAFLKALHDNKQKDRLVGFTTVGPHRDDLVFYINKHEAQASASRGETRTAVLMAKIIELKLLEEHSGVRPTLLLDDVFSELDGSRRRAMINFLKPYQTLITTTDADAVVKNFLEDYKVIPTGES
jgi:DNA replication and repair protein RecF